MTCAYAFPDASWIVEKPRCAYVLVHAGTAIQVLDEALAREALELQAEMAADLEREP